MGIQLKGGNNGNNRSRNLNNSSFGSGELEETPQMRELRMKREAEVAAAKEALAKKQEEQRLKALAFEQRAAARKQREEEEEIKRNPKLAAEREQRLAAARAEEEQRARFKAEEEAKIEAERRVQEKKMDQTEALIAAIRAQVEKEKAAKAAATQKEEEKKAASGQKSSSNNTKPQFRTISPEEMAKLEEKKRMKAAGITPEQEKKEAPSVGLGGGISGGLGGLGNGPTLSNPTGDGPSLSNPTRGQQSLNGSSVQGGGLGIDITPTDKSGISIGAEESTVTLNTEEINAAVEKSKPQTEIPKPAEPVHNPQTAKPHAPVPEPVQVVGGSSTIIVDDGRGAWDDNKEEEVSWVSSGTEPQHVQPKNEPPKKDSFVDENGDVISVVPVRQRPVESNDVQSAYNIDFDDDDDDDMSFVASDHSSEDAAKKAEEARMAAEAEERRKAEEAKVKAEEETRRAEEEKKRQAAAAAMRKAEEEQRRIREAEIKAREMEEARKRQEEEARKAAEEEARRKAEEEARKAAEEEARRKAEEEARKAAEEEARRKAEEEAKKATSASASGGYVLPVGAEQFLGKYLTVNAISDQIVNAIQYINAHPSEPRNMVILGQYGFGTTTIAEDFARSFYALGICKNKTIAKIKGNALNRANIGDAIGKLQGGCLVIENAGIITNEKLEEIYQIVTNPDNDVIVIMTGQIETLSRIFKENVSISNQFKHLIQVHRITDMDVFEIAKNHATQLGYPCEPGAENNLRRRMQEVESGNLDRVLKIVDNAVSKAHNREMTSGEQEHHLVSSDFE